MARSGFALLLVAVLSDFLVPIETEGGPSIATGFTTGCARACSTGAVRGCLRITGGGAEIGIPLRNPVPAAMSEDLPEESDGVCTLVIVRHGQSIWNIENRFTGSPQTLNPDPCTPNRRPETVNRKSQTQNTKISKFIP